MEHGGGIGYTEELRFTLNIFTVMRLCKLGDKINEKSNYTLGRFVHSKTICAQINKYAVN